MIIFVRSKKLTVFITGVLFLSSVAQTRVFPQQQVMNQERISILPVASADIPKEELIKLTREFRTSLQITGRFEIQPETEMDSLFAARHFSNITGCNYALCLADAGKALGVSKVMRIDITKLDDLFATRIRIVQTSDAAIILDKMFNHSGNIDSYYRISIPEQIKAVTNLEIDKYPSWLLPSIVVITVLGIVYLIYYSFKSNSSSGGTGGGGSSTPQ